MQVDKYDIRWQVVRSFVKGQELEFQFKTIERFLYDHSNEENRERILNWIEGVKRGHHKNQEKQEQCDIFAEKINNIEVGYNFYEAKDLSYLLSLDNKQATLLYKDLFKRTEKWLLQGYNHKMQNDFIYWIYNNRSDLSKALQGTKYSIDTLTKLIESDKKNTYKFVF